MTSKRAWDWKMVGMLIIALGSVGRASAADIAPQPLKAPFDESTAKTSQQEWARYLKSDVVEQNRIGMKLALIPPGEFVMGSAETLDGLTTAFPVLEGLVKLHPAVKEVLESERPQHRVRITKPFRLSVCSVTVAQFREFVRDADYQTDAESDSKGGEGFGGAMLMRQGPEFNWRKTGFEQADAHPVVNISWHDAIAFCRWLSKKENKDYRLATEAEFEYACRAGTTTRYYCGDDPADLVKVANVADEAFAEKVFAPLSDDVRENGIAGGVMIKGNDGYAFTSPVGRFRPNAFGLYDMHGNAATWCSDWYAKDYFVNAPADDPHGPSVGTHRVVRGSGSNAQPWRCRSARRSRYLPDHRELELGFRVARDA